MYCCGRGSALIILLLYAFFMNFRPNGPYFADFVLSHNITKNELYNEIIPIWSYAQFPCLFLVMAFTDILRFRAVIWVGVLGYFVNGILLLFARSGGVTLMGFAEVTNALGSACEIAHKSYIFTVVPKSQYIVAVFYLNSAELLGKATSNFLAQILVDLGLGYDILNVISTVALGIAVVFSVVLPPIWSGLSRDGEYFEGKKEDRGDRPLLEEETGLNSEEDDDEIGKSADVKLKHSSPSGMSFRETLTKLKTSYAPRAIKIWSFWIIAIVSSCFMVSTSTQALWEELKTKTDRNLNGYAYGANFLVTSLCSFIMSRFSKQIEGVKWWWISFVVALLAVFVILPPVIGNLYVAYVCDILFQTLAVCTMCVCGFNIAAHLRTTTKMFAFVAGVNTCAGALLDTLMNLVVVDKRFLGFGPVEQYYVYSGWLVFWAGFLVVWYNCSRRCYPE